MKPKMMLGLLAVGALALLWIPSVTAASPGIPAPEASVLAPGVQAAVAAPSCGAAVSFEQPDDLLPFSLDGSCSPSACNKSCLIQGYDFGRCTPIGCVCRYYV